MISLSNTPYGLLRKCNDNAHDAWMALIDQFKFSEEKQESLKKVTNTWNTCRIKDASQDPDKLFNEL